MYQFAAFRQHAGHIGHRALHGRDRPGRAIFLRCFRHFRIRHVAHRLAVHLGERRFADAGQRHVGIGHDPHAARNSFDGRFHRAFADVQVFRVIEVRGRVDDALHDRRFLFRKRNSFFR